MDSSDIRKMAVLGAGTMGSQIAALAANHDIPITLLDIVPEGANDRSSIARGAIDRLKEQHTLQPGKEKHITPGNLEDDMEALQMVDWVVECVPEKLEIKQETYRRACEHLREGAMLSSNTSTLPLAKLREGLNDRLRRQLCITHFFNPPTVMPLLEIIGDNDNHPGGIEALALFADRRLGKNVVMAKDTPGFIANRIGIYWMLAGLEEARRQGLSPEEADAIMGKPFGFPKTGIFGLYDLIGIRLIPDIADSMCDYLKQLDPFCESYAEVASTLKSLIDEGHTGHRQGGFYLKEKDGRKARNLGGEGYHDVAAPKIPDDPKTLLSGEGRYSEFTRHVLMKTLGYAAGIASAISNDIREIDAAMRDGYNWQKGPFELTDNLKYRDISGPGALIDILECHEQPVPDFLRKAEDRRFYHSTETGMAFLGYDGEYRAIPVPEDKWTLALKTAGRAPVLYSDAGSLWDIGDGIACLDLATKLNTIGPNAIELMETALDKVGERFRGLIIGSDDRHFTAGLNIEKVLHWAREEEFDTIEDIIRRGQQLMMRIKYAPFPVVPALSGMALGGGCELAMQAPAVQAHEQLKIGLVEVNIGVIPAWGGCKEHILRATQQAENDREIVSIMTGYFDRIAAAKTSFNAQQAIDMGILHADAGITPNRQRLLPEAKQRCLDLADSYVPARPFTVSLPSAAIADALESRLEQMQEKNELPRHQAIVLSLLAHALSGGQEPGTGTSTARDVSEERLLDVERVCFMELVRTAATQERIRHMLDTGKPLIN